MRYRTLTLARWLFAITAMVFPVFAQTADQFFAGTVVESTSEVLTVSRVLQGKSESRTFRVTSETKVEGKLIANARVTVGFEGDHATLIIVRDDRKEKNK